MSKTKTKTTKRVEWVVQWRHGDLCERETEKEALETAKLEAKRYGTPHRVVRRVIEETVVAEVKP